MLTLLGSCCHKGTFSAFKHPCQAAFLIAANPLCLLICFPKAQTRSKSGTTPAMLKENNRSERIYDPILLANSWRRQRRISTRLRITNTILNSSSTEKWEDNLRSRKVWRAFRRLVHCRASPRSDRSLSGFFVSAFNCFATNWTTWNCRPSPDMTILHWLLRMFSILLMFGFAESTSVSTFLGFRNEHSFNVLP